MVALGQEIKARRKQLKLRQDEVADLADVSTSFVRFVEHDKEGVRFDKFQEVLKVLGLEVSLKVRS